MPKGYHHVTREQRSPISALKAIETPLNKIAQAIVESSSAIQENAAICINVSLRQSCVTMGL
jgi:hypothetical protein